jgi:hypothetical protein
MDKSIPVNCLSPSLKNFYKGNNKIGKSIICLAKCCKKVQDLHNFSALQKSIKKMQYVHHVSIPVEFSEAKLPVSLAIPVSLYNSLVKFPASLATETK